MRERDELEGMLHDAAGRLSAAHVAALVAHPEAVCSALAAAADALAAIDRERSGVDTILGPASTTVDADEAERRLAARTRGGVPETLLTSEELAARTGLRDPAVGPRLAQEGTDRRLAEREARLCVPGGAARRP